MSQHKLSTGTITEIMSDGIRGAPTHRRNTVGSENPTVLMSIRLRKSQKDALNRISAQNPGISQGAIIRHALVLFLSTVDRDTLQIGSLSQR